MIFEEDSSRLTQRNGGIGYLTRRKVALKEDILEDGNDL